MKRAPGITAGTKTVDAIQADRAGSRPAGRRSDAAPDAPTAPERRPMDDLIVPFETAYERSLVPKGCSVTHFEYPRVNGAAAIAWIESDQVRVAFRLHFRGPIEDLLTGSLKTSTLDVLLHAGQLWWPHGPDISVPVLGDRSEGSRSSRHLTAGEWRERIGRDRDLLGLLPRGMRTVEAETPSRFPMPDGSGETVARVQVALMENYRIHAGRVYVRGGPPVYAHRKLPRGQWIVSIVSGGCDRDVTGRHDVYSPPAHFESTESQQAFALGRFWLPGDEAAMRRKAPKSWLPYPSIEVRLPDVVPATFGRDLHLDALFRRLRRFQSTIVGYAIEKRRWHGDGLDSFADENITLRNRIKHAIDDAVAPKHVSEATTNARLAALRALVGLDFRLPRRHGRAGEIRPAVLAFRELERRCPSETFADDDLEALGRIGSM